MGKMFPIRAMRSNGNGVVKIQFLGGFWRFGQFLTKINQADWFIN